MDLGNHIYWHHSQVINTIFGFKSEVDVDIWPQNQVTTWPNWQGRYSTSQSYYLSLVHTKVWYKIIFWRPGKSPDDDGDRVGVTVWATLELGRLLGWSLWHKLPYKTHICIKFIALGGKGPTCNFYFFYSLMVKSNWIEVVKSFSFSFLNSNEWNV